MQTTWITNCIITPDGTRLECKHRHDHKLHLDANGEIYMNDGMQFYVRRSVNKQPAVDVSVASDQPFELQRAAFTWGTRGKDGLQKVQQVALRDLTTEHIQNILRTQHQIKSTYVKRLFLQELEYRAVFNNDAKSTLILQNKDQ